MTPAFRLIRRAFERCSADKQGLGAVEFAMIAPFMILLYVGSYQLMDAISAYRKVTVTARTLADLSTQEEQITPDQAAEYLDGARQVMTPYPTTTSRLVILEIAIDKNATPRIVWVCANDTSPKCATSDLSFTIANIDLPPSLKVPNTDLIFSTITFHYVPKIASNLIGPMTFSDRIFMNPRRSPSICLNTGTATAPVCMGEGQS